MKERKHAVRVTGKTLPLRRQHFTETSEMEIYRQNWKGRQLREHSLSITNWVFPAGGGSPIWGVMLERLNKIVVENSHCNYQNGVLSIIAIDVWRGSNLGRKKTQAAILEKFSGKNNEELCRSLFKGWIYWSTLLGWWESFSRVCEFRDGGRDH